MTKNEKTKPVSIYEMPDGKKIIRVRTLDEDFLLDPKHIDSGKEYTWPDAMERLKELGKDGFNEKQGKIIAVYHKEIDEALEEAGGDKLGWEWAVGESSGNCAWFYYPAIGALTTHYKYRSCQVRPIYAVKK